VFAQKNHPLVIFLDDLQWGDLASLHLLKILLTSSELHHFMILGAYRDNEVDASHPLILTIDEIEKAGTEVQKIVLSPLSKNDLLQLTTDTLRCHQESADPLVNLLDSKTDGNPFFSIQFLKTLYSEKLIYFNLNKKRWEWDINDIKKQRITENVVELLVNGIRKYPENIQDTLKFAACIGNVFDLRTLSIVRSAQQAIIYGELKTPIRDGLIYPTSDAYKLIEKYMTDEQIESSTKEQITYKFQHDRIQQAAYTLISGEDRKSIHYQIGKHILLNTQPQEIENNLFDIVGHMNHGVGLIQDEKEKIELAKMNLRSGIKAKYSAAYHESTEFLNYGIGLLPDDAWEKHYSLALELYKHRAQALLLSGNIRQAEEDTNLLLNNAADRYDKADVYLIVINQFAQLGDYKRSFDLGLKCLRLFDYSLPDISSSAKSQESMQAAVKKFQELMGNRKVSDLYGAHDIQDKDKSFLIRILSNLSDATFISLPPMFPYVIFEIVNMSIEYGYNDFSAVGFCWFPVITSLVLKDYNLGFELGQLSLALNERYNNQQIKSQTIFISSTFTIHWMFHYKEVLKFFRQAVQAGVENGDYTYSGYALVMIPKTILSLGNQISIAKKENEKSLAFLKKTNSIFAHEVEFFREFLNNLTNTNEYKTSFDCVDFNENDYLEKWQQAAFGHGLGYYVSYKSQLFFLFEQYEEAFTVGTARKEWLEFIASAFEETICLFFQTLSAFAIVGKCDQKRNQKVLETIKENTEKYSLWSRQCPENYEHKYLLIQAEQARVDGNITDAMDLYDKAIESASKNEYINNVAVANELAAKFYLSIDKGKIARVYFSEAHQHYYKWGALAKVAHLEERYPRFCKQRIVEDRSTSHESSISSTTISSSKFAIDYESIIKSTQTLSSEVVLAKLLEKLMAIIIENAGAQRGFFILNKEGDLTVEIIASVNPQTISKVDSLKLNVVTDLCAGIVTYVERTNKSVILNDAGREGDYTADPYIQNNAIKSVLCNPIINQGRLIGIIYLENNLSAGAFTENRIEILNILSSQAAISIENASLYNELEKKIAALRESEQKFRLIFDETFQFIGVLDNDGTLLQINRTALKFANIGIEQAIGKPIWDTAWLSHSQALKKTLKRAVKRAVKGELVRFEATHQSPDGKLTYVDFSLKPVTDTNGKVVQLISEGHDITARKQAGEELERYKEHLEETVQHRTEELRLARDAAQAANKAKSMFLANMSHELRTPLNAVLGFSSLMRREPDTTANQRNRLDIINRSGEHLLKLINDVLEMAKIEAGRIELEVAPFDLGALVRDVVDMMRLRAEEKGLRLLLDQSSEFPRYIKGDEGRIRQILMNLVGNAVKFTREGGVTIRLGVKDNDRQHLLMEVEDSGPGFKTEDQQRVFQPFVQLVKADSYKGTGLGLAITKHFVDMMGGRIGVASTPGKGSVFSVDLPLQLPAETEIAAEKEEEISGEVCGLVPGQPAWRILIAEDEPDNQILLQSLMSAIGLETKVALNGEEAVKIFQAWQPHLIWMDRRMPVMDGVEAAQRIRQLPGGREVPIIAVTASVFKEQQQELSDAGMDELVRKPYRFSEIYECMARHLGAKYVRKRTDTEADEQREAVAALTPAMLATIPQEARQSLHDALICLDMDRITAAVAELGEIDPTLARVLESLVENFDYPAILRALEVERG
jgi:PAS domain S-box-containing protein